LSGVVKVKFRKFQIFRPYEAVLNIVQWPPDFWLLIILWQVTKRSESTVIK